MKKSTMNAFIFIGVIIITGAFAMESQAQIETATLGGGCFWCMEAVFEDLEGVTLVESGYSGGTGTPNYKEVCDGNTGHAEVIQITFKPELTTFEEVLAVYFTIHDPTTLNRQGGDVGTQYRSVIFYHSVEQKTAARSVINQLEADKVYRNKVVTELTAFEHFYKAENYHQNYYANNRTAGYCRAVIDPKVQKFREKFAHKRK
ncbi:MAG: peptide-methionine (S)-S-oxide reductase MsrA [bacterium]|nr:peptide-methionine (S)-S-oxide reductase MsrA [bacterium]